MTSSNSGATCFGDPGSFRAQADNLEELTTKMLNLKADLEQRIAALVPGEWSGDAAEAYKQLAEKQLDCVLKLTYGGKDLLGADQALVKGLSEALQLYQQAESAAAQANLVIENLVVRPTDHSEQSAANARAVQQMVDQAVQIAKNAQEEAASAYEKAWHLDMLHKILGAATVTGLKKGNGAKAPGIGHNNPPKPAPSPYSSYSWPADRPWPKRSDYKTAAEYGTAFHNAIKDILRQFEGQYLKDGWRVEAVERTVGGTKRVDFMIVNDEKKQIAVIDWVTGPTESVDHATKGFQYKNESDIRQLLKDGYEYKYVPGMEHPSHRQ